MHRRSTTPRQEETNRFVLDGTMPVREILRPSPTVRSGTGVQHARLEMIENEASEVVVVDPEGRPVGLVQGDDLLHDALEAETFAPSSSHRRPALDPFGLETDSGDEVEGEQIAAEAPLVVDDVLSSETTSMQADGTICEAASLLRHRHCDALLIVDSNSRFLGIVTPDDIVGWVGSASSISRRASSSKAD
jgi:CBS domain-containing protein